MTSQITWKAESFACPLNCGDIIWANQEETLKEHFQTKSKDDLDKTLSLLIKMRQTKVQKVTQGRLTIAMRVQVSENEMR